VQYKLVNRKIRVKLREYLFLYRIQFRFGGCDDGGGENDNDDSKIMLICSHWSVHGNFAHTRVVGTFFVVFF
jgi:hypothetical protein